MWILQVRAVKKGPEEHVQGSEAELGPEGPETLGQAEQQTELFQVRSQSKGGGRAEYGICGGMATQKACWGRWGCH